MLGLRYSDLTESDKSLFIICGVVLCMGVYFVGFSDHANLQQIGNACHDLYYLTDENINIDACVQYLNSNPDATGQEVLDHLDRRNVDIINRPLLRDT